MSRKKQVYFGYFYKKIKLKTGGAYLEPVIIVILHFVQ